MDNKPEVIDPSELLTLCMPTYNRVVNVCEALEDIIPKIRPYNFRLIVVDNKTRIRDMILISKRR